MQGLDDSQARIGLGAMKAVAALHGFTEEERHLVRACADVLSVTDDVDALPTSSPEEAARAFTDDLWRHRLLQTLVATAMVDGDVTREETDLIDAYAKALGVTDGHVKNLHRVLDGQLMRLRFDVVRRVPLSRQVLSETYQEEGLRGLWKFFKAARGHNELDGDLAWHFKRLGLLSADTLGRQFWEHMTTLGFPFPGEPHEHVPVRFIHHELTHVLCGYNTEAEGECQIAAFYAGHLGDDPFIFVFLTMVMYQLGVAFNPVVTPTRLQWDPQKVIRALQRGAAINTNLTDHWDFWPDLTRPIDEVRRKYNILPQ